MKRLACLLAGFSLAAVTIGAQEGKPPTVKEIMRRLHKDSACPNVIVRTELQDAQPDWAKVQGLAMDFVTLGTALGKNDPPRGERKSWTRLSGEYLDLAKTLDLAAQKKDRGAALAAHERLNKSCKGCHDAHRPN